ncbi:MAG: AMIN domain-containing protein, partial [Mariprofundaceae bacterium]
MNTIKVWVVGCVAGCMMMPIMAQAGSIQGVSLLDSASGEVLRIEGDSALKHEVFDVSGPPRMIISFPGTSFKEGLSPIHSDSGVVNSVFPVDGADGVRLEIGLNAMTAYDIQEQGNALVIKFASTADVAESQAEHAVISDVQVKDQGGVSQLTLGGSNLEGNHNAFLTNNQRTLILDFWGGSSNLVKENYQFSSRYIESVTVGQAEGRVRFVVNLLPTTDMKYQIDASSGKMLVRVGRDLGVAKKGISNISIESVQFQPDDRVGHIVIQTSELNPVVNLHEKDGNILIDFANASLVNGQERTQDLRMLPGPVTQIDSYKNGDNVRIVARLRTAVNTSSFQQGNVLTINLEPEDMAKSSGDVEGDSALNYEGQKVTFDFKDIDIRNALKLIAEMSDMNLIMSDEVSGTLTMRMIDVPWDQALDIILRSRGLGKQEAGNVV